MVTNQFFSAREHERRDGDQLPGPAFPGHALEDVGDVRFAQIAGGPPATDRRRRFGGRNRRREESVATGQGPGPRRATFVDESFDEHARVEIRVGHRHQLASRASRIVADSGFPLIFLGRNGGIGPRRVARMRSPAASIRRIAASIRAGPNGVMTAIGFPRSVRTTSCPALTARIAFEHRWFASRRPICIGVSLQSECSDRATLRSARPRRQCLKIPTVARGTMDAMTRLGQAMTERILVLDGAMGTMLQAANLGAGDFGGPQYEGCNEHLNLTRPDVVRGVHHAYREAGADLICTNTFGCAPYVLGEYGLAGRAHEIALAGARLAREAAGDGFVIGAMGPGTRSITVTRNVTFDEVRAAYALQARALVEGGVDALLLETQQDTLNLKAAALGVRDALSDLRADLPLMVSATIEPMGTMLAGQSVEALYVALQHLDVFSIGLNCATGPEFMTDHLRTLAQLATRFVTVYPNAGLPDERGQYGETPESLAVKMRRFVDEQWVNAVGGCCGTTPAHIRALAKMVRGRPPRAPVASEPQAVSGIDVLYPTEDNRPIFVGERTNVIGSRRFKELIVAGQVEEAAEIGRAQVKNTAHVLDVCLANPDRDESTDMDRFMGVLTRKVKVPLMIDSTDAAVIELALRHCQGKAIVNSINLEDGEERFEKVCPLLRTYGAAVIVGCIDEDKQQGMAVTAGRNLAIADRRHALLTQN